MTQNVFDILVIGAGPAGYVAAIRGAQLGFRVACIEKQYLGGTCLNVGCIPSKALLESSELYAQAKGKFKDHGIHVENVSIDFGKFMTRKDRVVKQLTSGIGMLFKKNKVTHISGTGRVVKSGIVEVTTISGKETHAAPSIIIATGSLPIEIPQLPFDGKYIVDSTSALSLPDIPKEMIVIGGGYIGLEMGSVYSRLGSKVTIIEALDRIVPTMDADVSKALEKILTKEGMTFMLGTKVRKATVVKNRVEVNVATSKGETTLNTDIVLVAVGRKAATQGLGLEEAGVNVDERGRIQVDAKWQTSVPRIYAIGDAIAGPMLAHKASEEGVALVEQLAGHNASVNYSAIPGVVYTYPEAASVGLTEEEAKNQGIEYKVATFPLAANGRAISMGEKDGFVKLIANKNDDRLIGAHIIAPRASDMIAELVLGVEFSATATDLALTIHAHPTLAEAVKEAALGLGTGMIHL